MFNRMLAEKIEKTLSFVAPPHVSMTGGSVGLSLFVNSLTDCCPQVGVKVSGFAPRITALESVLYMIIDQIKDLPKPVDAEGRKEAAQVH